MTMREEYIALRKAILEKEYGHLNDMQRQAVLTAKGPLLILAGAGSGKTTVLINRIAYLIRFGDAYESQAFPDMVDDEVLNRLDAHLAGTSKCTASQLEAYLASDPVPPWKILAITFTNKAANELKERLARAIGSDKGEAVWASTFHSACVRILRKDCERIGYQPGFTIYDTVDQKHIIKEILAQKCIDDHVMTAKEAMSRISCAKDRLQTPQMFAAEAAKDPRDQILVPVYQAYQQRLKESNAFDFDDLIIMTVRLLETCPDVLDYYQSKFDYVLVDEYQDTNTAQYRLVSLLSGKKRNICVVGDDDQSIYSFRGATIANILGFEEQYSDAKTIRLEQNYRSTGHILAAANSVIANNRARKGKNLWTEQGDGEKITYYTAVDGLSEASFVAGTVLKGITGGKNFRDYAILYRTNAQSNALEIVLRKNGIPYRVVSGTAFFEREEIKDMMAYLQVISNPMDDLRLKRIINKPARGIGDKTVSTLETVAENNGFPLFEAMELSLTDESILSTAARGAVAKFMELLRKSRELSQTVALDGLYDILVEATGYADMLLAKPDDRNLSKLENIKELKSNIVTYMKEAEAPSLQGFLEEMALFTDLDQYTDGDDKVTLMTVHSAKGLEFPTVFLVGMEEGIFPSLMSMARPESIEEERRLAYVAVTRARQELYISRANQRLLYGKTEHHLASRFLEEIPETVLNIRSELPQTSWDDSDGWGRRNHQSQWNAPRVSHTPVQRTFVSPVSAAGTPSHRTQASPAKPQVPVATQGNLEGFVEGARLHHSAFGEGIIVQVKPTAGDLYLTVKFDNGQQKMLMAKYASRFLTLL